VKIYWQAKKMEENQVTVLGPKHIDKVSAQGKNKQKFHNEF